MFSVPIVQVTQTPELIAEELQFSFFCAPLHLRGLTNCLSAAAGAPFNGFVLHRQINNGQVVMWMFVRNIHSLRSFDRQVAEAHEM